MSSLTSTKSHAVYHSVNARHDIPSDSEIPLVERTMPKTGTKLRGSRKGIAWNAILLTIPMLLLTTILFAFVFRYQVTQEKDLFPNLKGSDSSLPKTTVYYVNLNSTFLIFLTSWMSSLAPMLVGFAITLALYPIAERLVEDSSHQHRDRMVTPFQFSLAVKIVDGSTWGALWDYLLYRCGWGKQVPKDGATLASLLRATSAIMLLGLLVFGADTWLHIMTKSVNLVLLSNVPNENAAYSLSLLSPNCTLTNNTISQLAENDLICTMDPDTALLRDGTAAMQTLNNQSNAISVLNNGPDPTYAYLALSSSQKNPAYDFTATTFGMKTECKAISQACGLSVGSGNISFDCFNGSFKVTSTLSPVTYAYFGDAAWENDASGGAKNPYYYGVASVNIPSANPVTDIADDPDVITSLGIIAMILSCNVTLYDVEYDQVQGNVIRFSAKPSNTSVVNVFQPGLSEAGFGIPNLENALKMAGMIAIDAQDLSNQFAIAYSKIALSIGAGSFIYSPALAAQLRSTALVSEVPKAPLFLLVAVNLIFIVTGVGLAMVAARASPEAHEVQARFSIAGLVANQFEGEKATWPTDQVERLYGEYWEPSQANRVGLDRLQGGGYVFRTMDNEMHRRGTDIPRYMYGQM